MKKILINLKNNEDGVAVVLVAVALVVMLAMSALVVDIGALALEKTKLSNASDSAALAAAKELPSTSDAEVEAYQYLEYNGVLPGKATVSFNPDNTTVTVQTSRSVSYHFAQVIGINSGNVNALATATYGSVNSMTGIVPFGIPDQTLVYGQEYQLKAGSDEDYGPGNYGPLALELTGAKSYRNYMKEGYDGVVSAGEWIETEPGNMSGPTEDGVNYRISQCPHYPPCSIDQYYQDCPMVMFVPIYDPTSLNGRDEVYIVGFGAFLLKDVGGSGNDSYVSGYFLRMVPPEDVSYTIDPNQNNYGLYAAKLIQ